MAATKKIKFIRNTAYKGADYGPDYAQSVADVEAAQADIWVFRGRAVPAPADKAVQPGGVEVLEGERRLPVVETPELLPAPVKTPRKK